ncbi:CocE/NonD family hydrolase [Sphingoaurantiacus capsulatus]|uniref:CocE/NonD family hydrolase n=1 Tax=Sphingoaurantiacus capsulatus TaxID=1771310 RepID=A0ABV7XEV3_9SPHN
MLISREENLSHVTIKMSDGTLIAASLHLPQGDGPFPVLAIFYPYRKDDFIGASTAYPRTFFAEAGYATLLVDIRGYGSSGGPSYQAWDPREFDDGYEVVEWAARQDWCDGNVGIWGTSYGGAQALGIASKRPPSLKAIASIYGAADIYHDFVYPGGGPNGLGAAAWSAFVVALELAPPGLQDPAGQWLDAWGSRLRRLDDNQISAQLWPAHPTFDDYWKERVIPVEKIEVPSYFMTGWRDLLCQGMLDAYDKCTAPKQLLAGPWSHAAPDVVPDAPYHWLDELRQWFDRWMRGAPADDRPDVVYWVQGSERWCSDGVWPPAVTATVSHPAADKALAGHATDLSDPYEGRALVGAGAGLWYPMGISFGNEFDQGADDAKSLTYTSVPLDAPLVLVGTPRAHLDLRLEAEGDVDLCVKLVHVDPQDRATLITSGWQHVRADGEGKRRVTADIALFPTGYEIPAGHHYRWTVALADFPRLWPTPGKKRIDLNGATRFTLPVAGEGTAFTPPAPPTGVNRAPWMVSAEPICRINRDIVKNGVSITAGMKAEMELPQGGRMRIHHIVTAEMREAAHASAAITTQAELELLLASGEEIRVDTAGYATPGRRHLTGRISTGGRTLFDRQWTSLNGKPVG